MCPTRVNRVDSAMFAACPIYPLLRTLVGRAVSPFGAKRGHLPFILLEMRELQEPLVVLRIGGQGGANSENFYEESFAWRSDERCVAFLDRHGFGSSCTRVWTHNLIQ
jgi:hypothetical protein